MEKARTLIVDDNDIIRQFIRRILADGLDIEVIGEAADGQEAIIKAKELKPDLILMDVRMPGMNGLDALRRLKDEITKVKIIMLTGFDEEEYLGAANENGADGYLTKNSVCEGLLPTIRRALQAG